MIRRLSPLARRARRKRLRAAGAALLLAGLAFATWFARPLPAQSVPLVQVIDGDSLIVWHDGARVTIRLTGIDAVEYRQLCTRADVRWPCGREARQALERLAGRGPLHCALTTRDRYGRTLASCRTAPLPDGVDLGAEMVRQGWAVASDADYRDEEAGAEAARRGIWQGDFAAHADWRAAHARPATASDGLIRRLERGINGV